MSCYEMNLELIDLCDKWKDFCQRRHGGIGQNIGKDTKPKCEKPWLLDTKKYETTIA